MNKGWAKAPLAALAIGAATIPASARTLKVGDVAPDAELTLIDGSKVKLSSLRGQVVVLNFWATWCTPCRAELPTLGAYYSIQSKFGLHVYAITTEDSLPLSQLKKLFALMRMPSVRRIKGPYDVLEGVPTNYVIDRSGHIRWAKAEAFDVDRLNEVLVPLLKEKPPADAPAPAQGN